MEVSISFIATGDYLNYLPKWYEYLEKNLFPGIAKKILVFTDGELYDIPNNFNVYHIPHKKWPYITLERFETLLIAKEEIQKTDWFIFLDADTLVVSEIKEEDFFANDKNYIGVHHPCHYLKMRPHDKYPGSFETNIKSKAAVEDGFDFSVYYQGCVWGGRVPKVIEMIEELYKRTKEDLENGVIALWHDESHLNKFYLEVPNEVKVLPPSFAYPHNFASMCNFPPKIVHSKDFSMY